jgi:hypothetical protein
MAVWWLNEEAHLTVIKLFQFESGLSPSHSPLDQIPSGLAWPLRGGRGIQKKKILLNK